MTSVNPFAEFRVACETVLKGTLERLFPELEVSFALESPPAAEFGELSSSVSFELAKLVKRKPLKIAEQIVENVNLSGFPLVKSVKAAGEGYVNFFVDLTEFGKLTLESALALDREYGFVQTEKRLRIIVEHTSANPIHPIHIGTARNPVLGDALARILKARGHTVYRHYYVDDVGRQAAVIAYGYDKLGEPEPGGKPDHFIGVIYAITSCIVEIQKLKKAVQKAKQQEEVEISKLQRELDEWTAAAAELQAAHPQLFNRLLDEISGDENPEVRIAELNLEYERGGKEAKQLIRRVSELCLIGFKKSLSQSQES